MAEATIARGRPEAKEKDGGAPVRKGAEEIGLVRGGKRVQNPKESGQ